MAKKTNKKLDFALWSSYIAHRSENTVAKNKPTTTSTKKEQSTHYNNLSYQPQYQSQNVQLYCMLEIVLCKNNNQSKLQ